MPRPRLHLAAIIGSTREDRSADVIADWVIDEVRRYTKDADQDDDLEVIDLAEAHLPPRHPARSTPAVDHLDARVAAADGFVVITPEYNHSFPASLKHAIDLVHEGWQAKPVGLISYGGISGGLRAVEQLRLVFAELHAVTIRDTVSFHGATACFDAAGRPKDDVGPATAMTVMLDRLTWWARALRTARTEQPYAA